MWNLYIICNLLNLCFFSRKISYHVFVMRCSLLMLKFTLMKQEVQINFICPLLKQLFFKGTFILVDHHYGIYFPMILSAAHHFILSSQSWNNIWSRIQLLRCSLYGVSFYCSQYFFPVYHSFPLYIVFLGTTNPLLLTPRIDLHVIYLCFCMCYCLIKKTIVFLYCNFKQGMIPDKPLWFLITPSAGSSFLLMLLYFIVIYTVFYESVEINEIEIEIYRY